MNAQRTQSTSICIRGEPQLCSLAASLFLLTAAAAVRRASLMCACITWRAKRSSRPHVQRGWGWRDSGGGPNACSTSLQANLNMRNKSTWMLFMQKTPLGCTSHEQHSHDCLSSVSNTFCLHCTYIPISLSLSIYVCVYLYICTFDTLKLRFASLRLVVDIFNSIWGGGKRMRGVGVNVTTGRIQTKRKEKNINFYPTVFLSATHNYPLLLPWQGRTLTFRSAEDSFKCHRKNQSGKPKWRAWHFFFCK